MGRLFVNTQISAAALIRVVVLLIDHLRYSPSQFTFLW